MRSLVSPSAAGLGHKSLFRDLFWRIWKSKKSNYPTNKQKCYMFEMVHSECFLLGCSCYIV